MEHVQTTEASSRMRERLGARCTDARLYTLRIKEGTRTMSARENRIVELASGFILCTHFMRLYMFYKFYKFIQKYSTLSQIWPMSTQ